MHVLYFALGRHGMRRIGGFHSAIRGQPEHRHHDDRQCSECRRQHPAGLRSGTAFSGADTTSTTVTAIPTSLANGQAVSITATVADQTHTGTHPTGSVTINDTLATTTTTLSSVSLNSGAATLSGVVLHGVGTHTLSANYAGVSGSYAASGGTVTVLLSKAAVTVSGPTTQPVAVSFGQSGSVTITVAGAYSTVAAPTGTISYSILNSSNVSVASGTPALTAGTTSSSATIPIPSTLANGIYTISVTYSGDGNYSVNPTATSIQLSVGQITPTISWNPGDNCGHLRSHVGRNSECFRLERNDGGSGNLHLHGNSLWGRCGPGDQRKRSGSGQLHVDGNLYADGYDGVQDRERVGSPNRQSSFSDHKLHAACLAGNLWSFSDHPGGVGRILRQCGDLYRDRAGSSEWQHSDHYRRRYGKSDRQPGRQR